MLACYQLKKEVDLWTYTNKLSCLRIFIWHHSLFVKKVTYNEIVNPVNARIPPRKAGKEQAMKYLYHLEILRTGMTELLFEVVLVPVIVWELIVWDGWGAKKQTRVIAQRALGN